MYNVEDFSVNINWTRSHKECARSDKFKPLFLLQKFYFFLRRDFLFSVIWILLNLFSNFVSHLLKSALYLCSFLLYQLLQLLKVICFFSKSHSSTRIALKFIKFKPKFNMNTYSTQMIYHYLLNIYIFKGIGVIN